MLSGERFRIKGLFYKRLVQTAGKRLVPSRLHELHESKFPFVTRVEFIRSKLSNFYAHVSGVTVDIHCIPPPPPSQPHHNRTSLPAACVRRPSDRYMVTVPSDGGAGRRHPGPTARQFVDYSLSARCSGRGAVFGRPSLGFFHTKQIKSQSRSTTSVKLPGPLLHQASDRTPRPSHCWSLTIRCPACCGSTSQISETGSSRRT